MDGEETLKALQAIHPEVKAIVSSGYAEDEIMAGCSSKGFVGMIPKPYSLADMEKALRAAISKDI